MSISASEARKRLYPLIEEVNADQVAVEIVSTHGTASLVSADEYRSLTETMYLLRSPANAKRLLASVERIKAGMTQREVETILGTPPQHSWRGLEGQVTANTPLYYHKALMWSGTECDILVYLDDAGIVIDREGVGGPPPSWLDRLRKRLGV